MRRMFPLFLAFFLLLTGCSGPADLVLSTVKAEEPPADYDRPTEGFRYARSQLTPQQQAVYDTLAAGLELGEGAAPDVVRMRLRPGSTAVIASDGVIADTDDDWIKSLLGGEYTDMKSLARGVLREAEKLYGAGDDMTVVTLRVEERA